MMRSLFTGVSGLNSLQFGMDVIGNNVANVNTVGFKGSRAEFADQFYQSTTSANATRPVAVEAGLGAFVNGTTTSYAQGSFQRTDISSDVGIQGKGFFSIASAADSDPSLYTRAGNFVVDKDGKFRTADGYYLKGYEGDTAPTGGDTPSWDVQVDFSTVTRYSVGNDGALTTFAQDGTSEVVGYLALATFTSEVGLSHEAGTYFSASAASGDATYSGANTGSAGAFQGGVLEQSNADLSRELVNMIITQRGFDANARIITTSDELLQTAVNLKR